MQKAGLPPRLIPMDNDHFSMMQYSTASEQYAQWYINQLKERKDARFRRAQKDAPDSSGMIFETFKPLADLSILEFAQEMIVNGTQHDRDYIQKVLHASSTSSDPQTFWNRQVESKSLMTQQESCLSELWTTRQRTMFLDLTAGPFEWGPVVNNEGAKTSNTIPKVPDFSIYRNSKDIQSRMSKNQERIDQNNEQYGYILNRYLRVCNQKDPNAESAEKQKSASFCESLLQKMGEIQKEIAYLQTVTDKDVRGSSQSQQENSRDIVDTFLADLSSTLASSLRHLVAPPAPLFPTPYYPRVVIEFNLIIDQNSYDPLHPHEAFDYERFVQEARRLELPDQQEFTFTIKRMKMIDNPSIATAFHSSIRTVVLPTLSVDGDFLVDSITYIDSLKLRDELRSAGSFQHNVYDHDPNQPNSQRQEQKWDSKADHQFDNYEGQSETKHIPIFFFSVDRDLPLLVDKYYTAKGLSDMIVVVQSKHQTYMTRVSCNHQPVYINLRDPLRHILSAFALNLGGLIPPHVTYNQVHHNAAQNWLWSIGDNPLTYTSHGTSFNRMQIDTVYRNQLAYSLQQSIESVNGAIEELSQLETTTLNFEATSVAPIDNLKREYESLLQFYTFAASELIQLRFASTAEIIKSVRFHSRRFVDNSKQTIAIMNRFQCLKAVDVERSDPRLFLAIPVGFLILNVTLLCLAILCRSTSLKMKTN